MDSSNTYVAAFFFSFLVIFGAFFLLNLILAVIIEAYMSIDLQETQKIQAKRLFEQ